MSFIFTMRSTGRASSHRRDPASGTSLPAISEDSASFLEPRNTPTIPPRAVNRPSTRIWALGEPPVHSFDSPPPYNVFDDTTVIGPKGEKLSDVRRKIQNKPWIAKRGGWKRLQLGLIILLCIVGLIVGLVVGLRRKNSSNTNKDNNNGESTSNINNSSNTTTQPNIPNNTSTPNKNPNTTPTVPNTGPSSNPAQNTTFPAGSYRFETYLSTVATNCTSNPATWLCYPYQTYSQSRTSSNATFDWIITPSSTSSSSTTYTISSTPNPFSITFTNLTLALLDPGLPTEHYFFQTMLSKPTKPSGPLTSSNVAATCYFNSTTFHGYLYTKTPKTYGSPGSTEASATAQAYSPWPYAAKVEQVAAAGNGVPDCVGPGGESLGDFAVGDGTQLCDCLYLNTGT